HRPDDPGTRWNRALLLLLGGEFQQGWKEYEWRWRRPDAQMRQLAQPRWKGEPLEGRRILVYSEQGLGDTIQFLRYLPLVRNAGGDVIFECHTRLVKLLDGLPQFGEVIGCGSPLPAFDLGAPLLSLPGIFGTTLETIPRHLPYLAIQPNLIEAWRR